MNRLDIRDLSSSWVSARIIMLQNVNHAWVTCWRFTSADIKTLFLPVMVFAGVVGPFTSILSFFQTAAWIWVHLLHVGVSNQSSEDEAVAEDAINKPWRPIPAGYITVDRARGLRRPLAIGTALVSLAVFGYGVMVPSLLLSLALYLYNEQGLHNHPILKNLLNLFGFAFFEWGATLVAGDKQELDHRSIVAIVASSLIIFTTIHASDFCDAPGDAALGRKTLPIVFPEASRISIPVLLISWSLILCTLWQTAPTTQAIFTLLGGIIGLRFWWKRNVEDDKKSYVYYNVWLTCAHILPILSVS